MPYTAVDLAAGHFIFHGAESDQLAATIATRGRGDYPGLGWIVVALQPVDTAWPKPTASRSAYCCLG